MSIITAVRILPLSELFVLESAVAAVDCDPGLFESVGARLAMITGVDGTVIVSMLEEFSGVPVVLGGSGELVVVFGGVSLDVVSLVVAAAIPNWQ